MYQHGIMDSNDWHTFIKLTNLIIRKTLIFHDEECYIQLWDLSVLKLSKLYIYIYVIKTNYLVMDYFILILLTF